MAVLYRMAAGVITLLAVAVQYWILMDGRSGMALVQSSVQFFSFFTILTNVLAGVALLLPAIAPRTSLARFLMRPSVRTAITGYIVIVGVVYYLLLRNVGNQHGLGLFVERSLHYLTPPLFVLDWLLFVPKHDVGWKVGIASLGYPLVYSIWTLAHGALTGWYPYPFVDVTDLGYPRVLINMAGLVGSFLGLELSLVGIGRLIAQVRATRAR